MLKVKLLHPEAKLPTVTHAGSDLGFDLYSVEDVTLEPGVPTKVRTGIAVEGPEGYGFILGDRSSMAAQGVTYAGGRIDAGYRGEILVCLINVNQPVYRLAADRDGSPAELRLLRSDVRVHIRKGDKVVQMSPFRVETAWPIEQAAQLSASDRAERGFGSSGR
ncbi:MAG: dUTP diphosphatase [Acidobacteriaceae bacterium]